jgi:DNA-binding transcriptional LysR family regulator
VLVGTPGYFAEFGTPQHPDDLLRHHCLQHKFKTTGKLERWPLRRAPDEADLVLPESLTCSTIEAIAYVAQQGRGIAFLPSFIVRDALESGQLRTVLDDYMDRTVTFWMLWPASRYASPKLRVFIDYMSQHLRI